MKPRVKILVGIPGSGKSTRAIQLTTSGEKWVKVSRDDFRRAFTGVWYPGEKFEDLVTAATDSAISLALEKGFDVVIDNTHCKMQTLKQQIAKWASRSVVDVEVIGSELSLAEVKERNKRGDKTVPEDVIDRMAQGFRSILSHKKEIDNYIKECSEVKEPTASTAYKQNSTLPKAIIVDLDGTVARMNGKRGPFDWYKVDKDDPVHEVLNIVRSLRKDYQVIFMSGRDTKARGKTELWLDKYYGCPYKLYMRGENDYRKDSIVKEELFMQHVAPHYYVEACFDDRDQVVDLWRNKLGLKCMQVDYGNF